MKKTAATILALIAILLIASLGHQVSASNNYEKAFWQERLNRCEVELLKWKSMKDQAEAQLKRIKQEEAAQKKAQEAHDAGKDAPEGE